MALLSNYTLAQYLNFFVRILVACVCGATIGYERTKRFKEAGLRTHIIVCCGAALIMIVSIYGFEGLTNLEGIKAGDPARLAAQAVTGISFMGAGVIYKNGSTIHGLTTAAGLWTTALIGLAIGAGMFGLGVFTTVLLAVLQFVMHKPVFSSDSPMSYTLKFVAKSTKTLEKDLQQQLFQWRARVINTKVAENEKGQVEYEITFTSDRIIAYEDIHRFFTVNEGITDVSIKQ